MEASGQATADIRRWCPTHWLDEVMPELLGPPDAFIAKVGEALRLRDVNHTDGDSNPAWDEPLVEGQIVDFCYTEDRGTVSVRIADDRSWQALTPVPTDAYFWTGDPDGCLGDDLDDLRSQIESGSAADFPPGDHEFQAYFWSDEIPYRLEGGSFVLCAGAS